MTLIAFALTRDRLEGVRFDRCALDEPGRERFLRALHRAPQVQGAVVLGTCRRTEIYVACEEVCRARRSVRALLRRHAGWNTAELDAAMIESRGREAVRRLLRIASGLESAVLGEPEILGQVRRAAEESRAAGTLSPVQSQLFQAALRAGRRVRHETGLARGQTNLPALAVEALCRQLRDVREPRVLLLGAGEMARAIATQLRKERDVELLVASRTFAAARRLAAFVGGVPLPIERLRESLSDVDAIAAAVSGGAMLSSEELGGQSRLRGFVDLSTPAALPDSAPSIEGVHLHALEALAVARQRDRAGQIPAAAAIVEEEAERFERWLNARQGRDLADAVMRRVEQRRAEAVRRFSGETKPVSPEDVDSLSRKIISAVVGDIAETIRSIHPEDQHEHELIRRLFKLDAKQPRELGRQREDNERDEGAA